MIKLGVNSVLFSGMDFATAARLTKLCGYDGIEVSAIAGMCEHLVLDKWQEQADEIRKIAAENSLALLSMEVASLDEGRLEKAFAAGKGIGIPLINVGPGGKSNEPGALEQSVATLTSRAALAGKYGVTLCCKAHVGSAIFNTPTTLAAMKGIAHASFGVDMDPSHIWRAGEEPADALRQVVSRVKHIHIRDCKGKGPSPGEARDQACGRGEIDLMRYFRTLVEARYDGPVCLEVIGAGNYSVEQKMAVAAESYGYMNACLKALGAQLKDQHSMETINVGILGFAHGHVDAYCGKWREKPEWDVRVIAGWDHDAARLSGAVGKHGLAGCESSEALLARKDVQAVVIAAETSRHAELVEQAAAAGKAIIVQKPLGLTMQEADRMVAAVERHRVPFTLAWQMRVDPHNLQARELLASGKFGRVYMVRRRHCLNTQDWPNFDQTWHVQPQFNRDIFADDAAHPIDFIYWLLGRPVSVMAEMGTLLNPKIVNDNGIAVFRYADGSFAEVSCTFVAPAGENTLEIIAEKGVIIGNHGDVPSTNTRPAGAPQLKWWLKGESGWKTSDVPEIASQGQRIAGLAQPLAEFLHGKRPALATVAEGRDVLQMVQGCYESAQRGTRVKLW